MNSAEEVIGVFELFRDQQSELKLRFPSTATPLTARVVEVTEATVLLQNIIPANGMELMRRENDFSISGRANGLFVYIADNRCLECSDSAADGANAVRIALPTSILYQQRRRAPRYRLPVRLAGSESYLLLAGQHRASILDVSRGGARVALEPALPDQYQVNDRIADSWLSVPGGLDVNLDVVVRHANFNPRTQSLVMGLEFVELTQQAQANIDTFIADAAR
ncbi:MAG: PilZ domain-containing protein [Pseudomonadota bacterium]